MAGSEADSTLEILEVAEVAERKRRLPPTEPATILNLPPQQPRVIEVQRVIQREEVSDVMLAAFAAMGFALSARLLLLLAIIGGFTLGVMSMERQTATSLWVLGIYCVLVVLPMVWLEIVGKRPKD